jgi:hypothetical protein
MIIKSRKKIFFLLPLILILMVGCENSQFYSDYSTFRDLYLNITVVLDPSNPFPTIAKLNEEPILSEFDKMKNIVPKMNKEASTDTEKRIFDNVSKYYDGLEFLQYAAKNKDNLSEDERGRIATELTLVEMRQNRIKKGTV